MSALATTPQNFSSQTSTLILVGRLQEIPQVERVGLSAEVDVVHLWILFTSDDENAMLVATQAVRTYILESGPIPFDFHTVPLDEIAEGTLPEMITVFERR